MRNTLGGQEVCVKLISLLVAAVAAAVLLTSCGSSSPDVNWSWSWREVGTPEGYTLMLTPQQDGDYIVEYPRSFTAPFSAQTEDGKLLVWGENTEAIVWTLSYDEGSGELTAGGAQGTFHLKRVQK